MFKSIVGMDERLRMPRIGKIRLGKKHEQKGYPMETNYFVCPPEVITKYGAEPKELDIRLLSPDICDNFPTSYRYYGKTSGLKCSGNGEDATRRNEKTSEWEDFDCSTCKLKDGEKAQCKKSGSLFFLIPTVSMGGVYEMGTTGTTYIMNILSSLKFTLAVVGRVDTIPLKLSREEITINYKGTNRTHYSPAIRFEGNLDDVKKIHSNNQKFYELPAPDEINPDSSGPDDVQDIEELPIENASVKPSMNDDEDGFEKNFFIEEIQSRNNIPDLMKYWNDNMTEVKEKPWFKEVQNEFIIRKNDLENNVKPDEVLF